MESKKSKIIKMVESKFTLPYGNGQLCKQVTKEDFESIGLNPRIEYQEKYCDAIYAASIFRKMGARTFFTAYALVIVERGDFCF